MTKISGKTPDWDQIELEYVTGLVDDKGVRYFPSIAELAEKHGVKYPKTLGSRAWSGMWTKKRKEFREKAAKQHYLDLQARYAKELEVVNSLGLDITRAMFNMMKRYIKPKIDQAIENDAARKANPKIPQADPFTLKEMDMIFRVLGKGLENTKESMGLPSTTSSLVISSDDEGPDPLAKAVESIAKEDMKYVREMARLGRESLAAQKKSKGEE
jgi:hypothetical protein